MFLGNRSCSTNFLPVFPEKQGRPVLGAAIYAREYEHTAGQTYLKNTFRTRE